MQLSWTPEVVGYLNIVKGGIRRVVQKRCRRGVSVLLLHQAKFNAFSGVLGLPLHVADQCFARLCMQPLVEFLTQKGIRIKNVEKSNAPRAGGLQEAEIPTDEDDDDYGGEESETGTPHCLASYFM